MNKVVVFKTSAGDWKAVIRGDPFNFAFGVSGAEAIGNLVIANCKDFRLGVIVYKSKENSNV